HRPLRCRTRRIPCHSQAREVAEHSHFFFQAEDGIRDRTVTGVQTCALPISDAHGGRLNALLSDGVDVVATTWGDTLFTRASEARSEERRVGKEWPSRFARQHSRKN